MTGEISVASYFMKEISKDPRKKSYFVLNRQIALKLPILGMQTAKKRIFNIKNPKFS